MPRGASVSVLQAKVRPTRRGDPVVKAARSGPVVGLAAVEEVLGQTVADARDRYDRLTAREREVAGLMARGRRNRDIAAELGISPKTLDIHRANVMHKLEARTTAE